MITLRLLKQDRDLGECLLIITRGYRSKYKGGIYKEDIYNNTKSGVGFKYFT